MTKKIFISFVLLFNIILLYAQNTSKQDLYNQLDKQIKEGKITRKELLEYSLNLYHEKDDVFDILYETNNEDYDSETEYYYLILDNILRKLSKHYEELNDVEYDYIRLMDKCLFDLDKQENVEDLYELIITKVLEEIKYNTEDLDYKQFYKVHSDFMRLIGKHPATYFIELKYGLEIAAYPFDESLTYSEINDLFEILNNNLKSNWNELFAQYNRREELSNELIALLNDYNIEKEVIDYVKKAQEKINSKKYLTKDIILKNQTAFEDSKNLQKNFEDSLELLIKVADKNSEIFENEKYITIRNSLEATNTRITLFTSYYNEYAQKINKTISCFDNIATIKGIKSYFYLKY